MNTKREGLVLLQKNTLGRVLVTALAFIMMISAFFAGLTDTAYAATIGQKNKQACDDCERVVAGEKPDGYTGVEGTELGGGKHAVYSGGNSYSKSGAKSSAGSIEHDQDVTDFANPLPYGNVYVDTNKLNWDTPSNFIIDIQDDRFKWVTIGEDPLTDAMGNTSTNDPMELKPAKPLKLKASATKPIRAIAYVGPLESYHTDITAPTDNDGKTNVIEPKNDAPYLYRITYLNAVTLPNGTRGNLVLTMTKVQIETPVTVNEDNPFTPAGADYSYTKAIMIVQRENQLGNDTGYQYEDADGNPLNQQDSVVLTAEEAKDRLDEINKYYNGNAKLPETWAVEKVIRNAMGNLLDLDIEVTDTEGNPVNGTISYAAHDMDFESVQSIWGRTLGDEFSEGLKIVSGSQSYALVPNYNHADATTHADGWLPVGPGKEPLERALSITKEGDGSFADGVRFGSPFIGNYRDAEGTFKDAVYSNTALVSYQGDGLTANNNIIVIKPNSGAGNNSISNNTIKKQLYAMLKEKGYTGVTRYQDVTPEMAWDVLGSNYWKTYRNDADLSFDSGFAVLLDAKKSSIQWSGSRGTGSNLHTTLFDSSIYTYVEPTHGTGGGIYFETYDITDNCKVTRSEGVSTMGRGVDATVTAVPEDGYRVKTIMVGGEGLSNPTTYDVDTLNFSGGKYEDSANGVTIEKNADGTYDVTFANMQDPRHIHVDFTADYYFYKVWKGSKEPTDLKMTATPFAFVFKDVVLPDGKYTITDKGNTFTDPNGKQYTLENNSFTVGEGSSAVVYYLEGNSLVTYKTDSVTGERTIDKTYTIRLDYVKNGEPVEFNVTKADAEDSSETHVTKGTEDGYTIWKITYPEKGLTTKGGKEWKPLPIETAPSAHNINHVERNYWFVTEEAPGWSLVSYDNTKAEAAGHIDTAEGREEIYKEGSTGDISAWAQASTKDYTQAMSVIAGASEKNHAYMSVFNSDDNSKYSWGGKIVNVPALVVNVEKTWDDESNEYNTRKDVWFHLDGTITKDGKKTTIKDILPPQKLAADASGDTATLTWGKKEAYGDGYLSELSDYANVKVVGKASAIPDSDKYMQDATNSRKYIPRSGSGTTYYINELADEDGLNNKITYSVRETDKDGKALKQYTVTTEELKIDTEKVKVDNIDVDSYTSKIKNELETTTFKATKVWVDNDNEYDIRKDTVFSLNADGVKVEGSEKTIAKGAVTDAERTVEWTVPKYNTAGNEIKYTIDEKFVNEANTGPYARADSGDASAGFVITNTYPPHEETMTVTRTITYTYIDENGETASKTVVQTVNLKRKPLAVDKTTYKETWGDWEYADTDPDTRAVTSPGIDGWTADKDVTEWKINLSDPKDAWEHVIYTPDPPKGTPDETYGLKGQPQTGTPSFKVSTPTTPDDSDKENEIVDIKLVDPTTGNLLTEVRVPEGTYKLNEDGTVTFTPIDPNYTGDPTPITLKGTDKNGLSAEAKYTPHIKESEEKGEASRTIHYTYLTKDGKTASKDVKQTVKLTRRAKSINPKTGDVEWEPWEDADNPGQSAKFPAVPNPDDVDENTWTPDSSAQEEIVTEPRPAEDVHVVYTKEPYTVIYHNGDHGKSDGKGDQKGEDYNNAVTGGNGVTPAKGWHFTGKYTYVIKDKTGKVIETGETDDPKSVKITGNVEFTPIYAPNKYTIKYDANGGKGKMGDQKFTGEDDSATSKSNKFTRKGYEFIGFKAKLPDGTYLKDANGNDLIFKNPDDFIEYLHAQGDGGEITLVAQWIEIEENPEVKPADGSEGADGSGGASTGDDADLYVWICIMGAALAATFVFIVRRRRA